MDIFVDSHYLPLTRSPTGYRLSLLPLPHVYIEALEPHSINRIILLFDLRSTIFQVDLLDGAKIAMQFDDNLRYYSFTEKGFRAYFSLGVSKLTSA